MKIKTYKVKEKTILPERLSNIFDVDKYCVIDIETTGLSSQYHQVILVGILYNINDEIVLKQFFAEHPKDELSVLNEFANIYKNFSYVITFNGAAFDIPFLKKRFDYYNLNWAFDNIKHIDILQQIRKVKSQLQLENLKLKTIEHFVGINRRDTISGKDSVLLYKEYVNHPSPSLEKTILLHNYEDIYYLNKLLNIFDHIFIDKSSLLGKDIIIKQNSKNITFNFFPKDISIKKNILCINGKTQCFEDELDVMYYGTSFNFEWCPSNGKFNIEVPLLEGYLSTGEKCSYVSLEELNLSKSAFSQKNYYNDKYFPNNLMVLKLEKDINIHLIEDLTLYILESIFY